MNVLNRHLVLATIATAVASIVVQSVAWAGWIIRDPTQRAVIKYYLLCVDVIILIAFLTALVLRAKPYAYLVICVVNISMVAAIGIWIAGVGIVYSASIGFAWGASSALPEASARFMINPSS